LVVHEDCVSSIEKLSGDGYSAESCGARFAGNNEREKWLPRLQVRRWRGEPESEREVSYRRVADDFDIVCLCIRADYLEIVVRADERIMVSLAEIDVVRRVADGVRTVRVLFGAAVLVFPRVVAPVISARGVTVIPHVVCNGRNIAGNRLPSGHSVIDEIVVVDHVVVGVS